MTDAGRSSELDSLLDAARAATPSSITPERAKEIAARAILVARARDRDRRRKTVAGFVAVAALAAVVATRSFVGVDTAATQVAVFDTHAGDRLSRTSETTFDVLDDLPTTRRVALGSGTMLCDVRPLGPGSSFEVEAGAIEVRVRGTVFSVTRASSTVVRVFEGHVEVVANGDTIDVLAGEQWSSETREVGRLERGPLHDEGERAAALRIASRRDDAPASAIADSGTNGPAPVDGLAANVPAPPIDVVGDAPVVAASPDDGSNATPPAERAAVRTEPRDATPREVRPTPSDAESAIREGNASSALSLAESAIARGESGWSVVRADALRALGRHAQAADAYDATARSDTRHRAELAYAAAILRSRSLHDDAGALRSLDAGNVSGSALGERGLVLRVRLLISLGRQDEARADARRYLERFGDRGSAESMRALVGD